MSTNSPSEATELIDRLRLSDARWLAALPSKFKDGDVVIPDRVVQLFDVEPVDGIPPCEVCFAVLRLMGRPGFAKEYEALVASESYLTDVRALFAGVDAVSQVAEGDVHAMFAVLAVLNFQVSMIGRSGRGQVKGPRGRGRGRGKQDGGRLGSEPSSRVVLHSQASAALAAGADV